MWTSEELHDQAYCNLCVIDLVWSVFVFNRFAEQLLKS